ncbi:MAG: ammonium transporter [Leptospiraceae bacterium]|nr:ammonium transporter [Leptospiraceae bacterium]MDW7975951.1 ammonium transporter [Leptospiraceae bacterium]
MKKRQLLFISSLIFVFLPQTIFSQDENFQIIETFRKETDLLWLIIGAFLVFFMQPGFALVEAGFVRAKNTVNILMKNLSDFMISSILFFIIGFSLMFGEHILPGIGLGMPEFANSLLYTDGQPDAYKFGFFFFQLVFAGTSATIVSGAIAERTKFKAYLIFSAISSGLIYPVYGSLVWSHLFNQENVGILAKYGFTDFAGSTVVHSLGGWMGLAGSIIVGPRKGKYVEGGIQPILGHNLSLSMLGMFILWFGWFGFNPASTATIRDGSFAIVAVTTNIAAAAGGLGSLLLSWYLFHRPDASMVINGVLSGLVAITAGCYNVNVFGAMIIGFFAGIIVVISVILLDHLRIDDPVGAVSVHGTAGAWGTIAVGLFADPKFGDKKAGLLYGGGFDLLFIQTIGVIVAFVWAFSVSLLVFYLLRKTNQLRVDEYEEIEGLDIIEHGNQAYNLND